MDDARFDAWTRRRFGQAMSGGVAALIGLGTFAAAPARAQKKKKKTSHRCLNVRQPCNPDAEKRRDRCCARLRCGTLPGREGEHCCRSLRTTCKHASECCGELQCDTTIQSGGKRCCVRGGGFCQRDQDCCRGSRCDTFERICV
jgi:hypothetical protein